MYTQISFSWKVQLLLTVYSVGSFLGRPVLQSVLVITFFVITHSSTVPNNFAAGKFFLPYLCIKLSKEFIFSDDKTKQNTVYAGGVFQIYCTSK